MRMLKCDAARKHIVVEVITSSRTVWTFVMQTYLDPIFAISIHWIAMLNAFTINPTVL